MYDNDGESSSLLSMTDFLGVPKATPQICSSSESNAPLTGPELYESRRARWLQPSSSTASQNSNVVNGSGATAGQNANVNKSHARLEAIVNQQGVEEDDAIWTEYLCGIHESLVGGKKLKKGLKLGLAVKILKAGWLRDGTWETAAAASFNPSTGPSYQPRSAPSLLSAFSPSSLKTHDASSTIRTPRSNLGRGLRSLITSAIIPSSRDRGSSTGTTSSTFGPTSPSPNGKHNTTIPMTAPIGSKSVLSLRRPSFGLGKLRRVLKGEHPAPGDDGKIVTDMVDMMNSAPPYPYLSAPIVNKRVRTSSLW